jgi:hypothetical protein
MSGFFSLFGYLEKHTILEMALKSLNILTLGLIDIEITNRERDLGIIITSDLNLHEQVINATSNASRMLECLKKLPI